MEATEYGINELTCWIENHMDRVESASDALDKLTEKFQDQLSPNEGAALIDLANLLGRITGKQ
jgi:hypothetical protein